MGVYAMGAFGIIACAVGVLILLYGAVMVWVWWKEIGAWGWRVYCRWTHTFWYQVFLRLVGR